MGAAALVVGIVSAVAAVTGGIVQYVASQQQAKATREQAEAQARAAEENARQARIAAQHELYLHRQKIGRLTAAQEAGYAKGGVILEGTPLAVIEDTLRQAELDAMAIQYKGEMAARRMMLDADIYRQAGAAQARAYRTQAGTSLLSGLTTGLQLGSQAYWMWKK